MGTLISGVRFLTGLEKLGILNLDGDSKTFSHRTTALLCSDEIKPE